MKVRINSMPNKKQKLVALMRKNLLWHVYAVFLWLSGRALR